MLRRPFLLLAILSTLAGCDQLGLEAASVTAARVEADGKAVGAACRHGGRAIEDCFTLNKRVDKAAIYAGWREMDDYMRENKLEAVAPDAGRRREAGRPTPTTARRPRRPSRTSATSRPTRRPRPASAKPEKIARIDKSAAEKPVEH